MDVHLYAWIITVVVMCAILAVDVFIIGRRPHEPSMKEAGIFIGVFVALAILFGLGIWAIYGPRYAGEFFAGWLTEYSLSIDNLFIFVIIMGTLKVPRHLQQFALMIGIILALIFRGIFIAIGAAAIARFSWVFFIFGAFLIYTAVKLVIDYRHHDDHGDEAPDNAALRFVKKRFPSTDDFRGTKLTVVENGKRLITPMLIVIIALGSTDLLFALDSIPAIYGLTEEAYLVFTANVFALMGLRQLYFLIGGLLQAPCLPLHRALGDPRLHRRQAGPRGPARLPLGRLGPLRRGDPDLVLADLHHRHPRHHYGGQPDQEPVRRGQRRYDTAEPAAIRQRGTGAWRAAGR